MEGHFLLTSGLHSPHYVEKFNVLQHPRYTQQLCEAMAEKFKDADIETVVGPVTGAALGASSDVIALSIAAGVIKSIAVMILTPLVAKAAGLNSPAAAIVYGGLMGSTSGVAAGLAATDPKLVPYGAMTATFYTGLGCLLAPSALYLSLTPFF